MGFYPEKPEKPEEDRARREAMGLKGEPKGWTEITDYNPDHNRSGNPMYSRDRGTDVTLIIPVKGLGVLCFRAVPTSKLGMYDFAGCSLFSNSEIGYTKDL